MLGVFLSSKVFLAYAGSNGQEESLGSRIIYVPRENILTLQSTYNDLILTHKSYYPFIYKLLTYTQI